jgi:hypothetical protein
MGTGLPPVDQHRRATAARAIRNRHDKKAAPKKTAKPRKVSQAKKLLTKPLLERQG